MSLLEIRNLTVTFPTAHGTLRAVEALDRDGLAVRQPIHTREVHVGV